MKIQLNENKFASIGIRLEGLPQIAIIDTGCYDSFYFISSDPESFSYFEKTGRQIIGHATGGVKLECPEIKIKIKIGEYDFDFLCGLSNQRFGQFDMILGSSFLYNQKMKLCIKGEYFCLEKIED